MHRFTKDHPVRLRLSIGRGAAETTKAGSAVGDVKPGALEA